MKRRAALLATAITATSLLATPSYGMSRPFPASPAVAPPVLIGPSNGFNPEPGAADSVFWPVRQSAPGPVNAVLNGVTSLSRRNSWAVGNYLTSPSATPLVQHWNGTRWATVASPIVPYGALFNVTAISASDIWAVGEFGARREHTLTEHWNGARWSRVPSPSPSAGQGSTLESVTAISSTNVWAVGYTDPPGRDDVHALILHWNGARWTIVANPNPPGMERGLFGVSAASPTNIWAVGTSGRGRTLNSLIEHWDGRRWSRIPSDSPGSFLNVLESVTTVASGAAWTVGAFGDRPRHTSKLMEQTVNGTWLRLRGPFLRASQSLLFSASAESPRVVWAVGLEAVGRVTRTLILCWDGHHWLHVTSPTLGRYTLLAGVSAHGPYGTWAVGSHLAPYRLRWNGFGWTQR